MRNVNAHYSQDPRKEWDRLNKDAFRKLEFRTTLHYLDAHLPKRGLVLDAGGGPGRYTIELARRGYDVVLLDLVGKNLRFAERMIKRKGVCDRVRGVRQGDITKLDRIEDNSFDAVLCTGGPLSHVMRDAKRRDAVAELMRVAKRGAPVFISVMSRLSTVLNVGLMPNLQPELTHKYFREFVRTGDYDGQRGFTAFHGFMRQEFVDLLEGQGLSIEKIVALEGCGSYAIPSLNRLERNLPKQWEEWQRIHYETCELQEVADVSDHILAVCRK